MAALPVSDPSVVLPILGDNPSLSTTAQWQTILYNKLYLCNKPLVHVLKWFTTQQQQQQ